jgi:hypothetical protein
MTLPTGPQCPTEYPHLAHDWRSPDGWGRCPGIKIEAASRALPVTTRRHVVRELRAIKDALQLRINRWAVTGVEHDGLTPGGVPRRVDEFPENSPDAWRTLTRTARDSAADLMRLGQYAEDRARQVDAFNRRQAARGSTRPYA